MPMIRSRRPKQRRPFARLATFAVAFFLFTASAFFYAQDGKPTAPSTLTPPEALPAIPGIKLPTVALPNGGAFDTGREQLPAPAPATGRRGLPGPDLLPSAVMKPAKPDVPVERPSFDGGIVQATYRELSGRRDLVFTAQDKGAFAKPIGTLNWDVSDKQFVNGGLDQQFRTYCCEPLIAVMPGQTYKFRFDPIDRPEFFNRTDDEEGRIVTAQRSKFIRELYGRFYTESLSPKENAPAAFQAALWELVSESAAGEEKDRQFSLFNGSFRTTFIDADAAPEYVRMGEQYLKNLSGDDRVFFDNPTFDQLELVRLTGIVGEDGALAPQSQFTLRARTDAEGGAGGGLADSFASGGNAPLFLASAGGGGGGAPLLGGGGGSGGSRGGLGGGFPSAGGALGSGGQSSGSGSGTGTGTGTGSTSGSGTGFPSGTGGTGGVGGTGGNPTVTAVPAPPAVLLALAGVGVLAGGQLFRRKKK